jgi:hypothetical protein
MSRRNWLWPWAAAALAASAAAQSPAPTTFVGSAAPAQPLPYRSALDAYRPFTEEEVMPWREANDTVARIGGWREYARASREPAGPAPASSAPVAPAAPAGSTPRGGHGHH